MGRAYRKLGSTERALKALQQSYTESKNPEIEKQIKELTKLKEKSTELAQKALEPPTLSEMQVFALLMFLKSRKIHTSLSEN